MASRGRTPREAFATALHALLVAQYMDWSAAVIYTHHIFYVLHHESLAGV